ncbi:hypothetical protein FPV16_01870 [Methylobacterium sp. W2]|nr:hypothetical protein [Methylobacterium sp. W2]
MDNDFIVRTQTIKCHQDIVPIVHPSIMNFAEPICDRSHLATHTSVLTSGFARSMRSMTIADFEGTVSGSQAPSPVEASRVATPMQGEARCGLGQGHGEDGAVLSHTALGRSRIF